jgi:hypothetical protein
MATGFRPFKKSSKNLSSLIAQPAKKYTNEIQILQQLEE